MKFAAYRSTDGNGVALEIDGEFRALDESHSAFSGTLDEMLPAGAKGVEDLAAILRQHGRPIDLSQVELLPPIQPNKIICIGLNYADHAKEADLAIPEVPTIFTRYASSIVGPETPIMLPKVSSELDFEGELAVIIGKPGRYIDPDDALDHVVGYSCFNDGSIRDYQLRTPQWAIGKNFDRSGSFGPVLVTAEALPQGASGLAIETRLNGRTVQSSTTDQLIFDVAILISWLSEAFELVPGDVIATGTPSGVGLVREPPLWMQDGDVCEVEIEGIGTLRNPIQAEI